MQIRGEVKMVPGLALTDPAGNNALLDAAYWARSLLLGSSASIVATLAIAAIGFWMLQGRIPIRRGLVAVLGCFIIFGAMSIADGLMALGAQFSEPQGYDQAVAEAPPAPTPPAQPQVYDPYAGASVPVR